MGSTQPGHTGVSYAVWNLELNFLNFNKSESYTGKVHDRVRDTADPHGHVVGYIGVWVSHSGVEKMKNIKYNCATGRVNHTKGTHENV